MSKRILLTAERQNGERYAIGLASNQNHQRHALTARNPTKLDITNPQRMRVRLKPYFATRRDSCPIVTIIQHPDSGALGLELSLPAGVLVRCIYNNFLEGTDIDANFAIVGQGGYWVLEGGYWDSN
jgi:hypothetical protein